MPRPDFLEFTQAELEATLVLTSDGTALTAEVARQLEAGGHRVVVINFPDLGTAFSNEKSVALTAINDEAIGEAIAQIQQKHGQIGTFVHLHPHLEFQNGNFARHFPRDREIVKAVFLLAKHLQKTLTESGRQQRANFLTLTRLDGRLGLGGRNNVSIVGSGLTGLVKSLNLEWPSVFCRAVDIQPELPAEKIASQLIAELHDADRKTVETGFSSEGRCTLESFPTPVKDQREITTDITSDSVFLVSGGAKGVTAACVVEMAKTFSCKFILLGRSSNDFVLPDFAENVRDEGTLKRLIMENIRQQGEQPTLDKVKALYSKISAKQEIDDTLQQIAEYGGQAVYLSCDVTDAESVKESLTAIPQNWGPITGIIHGAGRLADKYIQDKTERDFQNVLSVKLDGLLSLLQSVDLDRLDHLVLFSSVAGFYGNVGQTDYAIANEILSKAAHLYRQNHPNTHVTAINWGAWDAGMVSPELKKRFEEAGVSLVNSEGGAAMLVNELSQEYAGQPQVIIGGTLPMAISDTTGPLRTFKIRRRLILEDNPFLHHHVIQRHPVLPMVNAVGWLSDGCELLYPGFRIFKIEDTKLYKGLVFDGNQAENFVLEAKEIEKNNEQIVFETTIYSEGGKLPTYHYRARITLKAKSAIPEAPSFNHRISGTFTETSGDYLYQDGFLFHGAHYQGVEKILDWTEKEIVMVCRAPEVPPAEQGQFPVQTVNAFFCDIQYQGMVIWVQRYHDGANSLPLNTESMTVYHPIPFGERMYVNVSVVENSPFKMVADCTVYDGAGKVYMITKAAALTVSKQLQW